DAGSTFRKDVSGSDLSYLPYSFRFHRGFSKLLRQPPDPREFIGHRPWNYGQCLVSLLGYRGWRYVTVLSHAAVSTTGMNLPDKLALP
ncbi:MAG TPA: hypothetical protein VK513_05285, partial [Terriglobales bacterium]|nr:hypothetical protein [Terriglobales bacterium]